MCARFGACGGKLARPLARHVERTGSIRAGISFTNYNSELVKIHSIATNNGYPSSMINRMINKKRRDITLNSIYPIPSENPNDKFYKLNYVKGISNKIINILKKYNIRTTYTNTNNKDKTDKFFKSGIYCINSNEWNAVYYGQIGRNLGIRATEHFKSISKGKVPLAFLPTALKTSTPFPKIKLISIPVEKDSA